MEHNCLFCKKPLQQHATDFYSCADPACPAADCSFSEKALEQLFGQPAVKVLRRKGSGPSSLPRLCRAGYEPDPPPGWNQSMALKAERRLEKLYDSIAYATTNIEYHSGSSHLRRLLEDKPELKLKKKRSK